MHEESGLRARKNRRTREGIRAAALRLFVERGYDETPVEQIAAAADVAPRTFYRYFPTKEDVVFHDPEAEETLRRALDERRRGESDVERVARAMLDAMLLHEERVVLARQVIDATPALQAQVARTVGHTADVIAEQLLADGRSRGRDARLRALLLAHCVATAVRIAVFAWIDGGRRGSAWTQCTRALGMLREAFEVGADG